ncbi:MAG: hypothetical protein JJ966_02640 [Balneolaceae bacterium]|nr:hypothetical protein [Balneolaceae bacterium]
MKKITSLIVTLLVLSSSSLFAQFSISGLADFELRHAGDDSSPYINQTPGKGWAMFTPNLRLIMSGDISDSWFVSAVLQADHYEGKKLSDPFFSVFNINWTPNLESDLLLTFGRFVIPYGSYSSRFLSFDNPFVHLPLSHASGFALSKNFGFISEGRYNPGALKNFYGQTEPGATMVYQRMYTQGLLVSHAFGEEDRIRAKIAATHAPASSHLDYGQGENFALSGRLEVQPIVWATLGLSASRGTFLQNSASNDSLLIYDLSSYNQELMGADLSLNYQYYTLNVEWNQSFWKAPYYNRETSTQASPRTGKATIDHYSMELIYDTPFLVGAHLAIRYEHINEGEIEIYERDNANLKINETVGDFTYARTRTEITAGYKLDRNIILKGSYLISSNNGPDLDDNVFAIQLSVLF